MLGWLWMRWLGVFIALIHFHSRWGVCWRWAHRTGTVPCPVGRHVTQPLGFGARLTIGALSSCGTGQSGATPDSPVPLWLPALTSAMTLFICQSRPLARASRCSGGSPDSPVAHRTVRWIIAEGALEFLRVAGSKCTTLVHRTVWCANSQHTQVLCSVSNWVPNLISFLVCVEPYAPVIHEF
jgi:hypothetical protein